MMMRKEKKKDSILKFLLCLVICLGGGWLTGLLTEHGVKTWYPTLNKPSWTPPNAVFPLAWTLLYTLMAISLWLVWISPTKKKTGALVCFFLQLFLNFIWSWLFFFLKSPAWALGDIVLLWATIFLTIFLFWRHSKAASYLLIPYFAWVTFAISLNSYIWVYN